MVAVDERGFSKALESLLERMGSFRKGRGRLVGISPHAPYSLSGTVIGKLARLARSMNAPLSIHVAETAEEEAMISKGSGALSLVFRSIIRTGIPLRGMGMSPVAFLDSLGALTEKTIAVHCVHVGETDIRLLRDRGCTAALCPTSNDLLGAGEAPVADLLEAGLGIAPGTDSAASNPSMDLFEEGRLLAAIAERQAGRSLISSGDLLKMITIRPATFLGLDEEIGSLTPGKFADFVVLDGAPADANDPNPSAWAGKERVRQTFLGGRPSYERKS